MTELQRARDRRGLLVSLIAFLGGLVTDFVSNVAANHVHVPTGFGGWLLHYWGLVLAGLATAGLAVFAVRRLIAERDDVPAGDTGQDQADTFPHVDSIQGRDDLVREVAARARRGVVVVHGPAGIGVSAVAITAGWVLAPEPGKQRYVDLRGQSLRNPESPRRSVIRILSAIGVRPAAAPDLGRAMVKLAETLRDTGIVLILDNAERAEQVSWITHGIPGAYVMVAGDIVARDLPVGLPRVRVPPLRREAALDLLTRQGDGGTDLVPASGGLGHLLRLLQRGGGRSNSVARRVSADRAAAAELADRYRRFPRVAIEMGRWLAANPQVTLAAVVQDLRHGQQNTELQDIVRRQLDGTSAGASRLLALLAAAPVMELPQAAVAAMADASLERTGDHLAELASRSLVEWSRPSRRRITPAARQLTERPGVKAAARAHTRLASHFARLAAAHAEALGPGQSPGVRAQADEWFRIEDVTLLRLLSAPGPPVRAAPYLWQIAAALDTWFAQECRQEDRRSAAQAMADAATHLGDDTAAAIAELRLSAIARERGDLNSAGQGLERAHRLLGSGDVRRSQLHHESAVYFLTTGDFDAAQEHLLACRQARSRRDAAGRIADLVNQASLDIRNGKVSAAHGSLLQALDIAEDSADLDGQAHTHELLGVVAWRMGHPHRAGQTWAQARSLYEQAGNDHGQARCLQHQGTALLAQPDGDARQAVSMLTSSLDLRADQQSGIGVALAHLYLAEQAATSANLVGHREAGLAALTEHHAAALAALRPWAGQACEPPEVSAARKRLSELRRGAPSH